MAQAVLSNEILYLVAVLKQLVDDGLRCNLSRHMFFILNIIEVVRLFAADFFATSSR